MVFCWIRIRNPLSASLLLATLLFGGGGMLAPILRTVLALRIWIRMDPELCLDQDPELLFRIKIQQ